MFLLVVVLSGYFISNVWDKWKTSPLIVTMGAHGTSVKDIPFPAVTICNMNQAQKSAVSLIPKDSEEYAVLQSICQYSVDAKVKNSVAGTWENFRKVLLKVILYFNSLSCIILLKTKALLRISLFIIIKMNTCSFKVTQPCESMLVACKYGGNDVECMDIFNSVLTDGGVCCIFNGVHRKFLMNMNYKLGKRNCSSVFFQKTKMFIILIYLLVGQRIFVQAILWKKWPISGHQRLDFNPQN